MSSASSQAALQHLRRIQPSDGWAIESRALTATANTVRLLRRNAPLTDNYFLDVHYDSASGNVVGILTPNRDGRAQGQVLVNSRGKPVGKQLQLVRVSQWDEPFTVRRAATTRTANTATSSSSAAETETGTGTLSMQENKQLLTYAAYAIGALFLFRVLCSAMVGLYVLAFPILYLYLVQNCPSAKSFEPKKEVKRVMRGYHLPQDHPDKPRGFMSETLARINATLATELATGMGYEVDITPLAGAAHVAAVRVPSAKMEFYWVGVMGRWYYVFSRNLSDP